MPVTIQINDCSECRDCRSEREYTEDSFETCFRFDCYNEAFDKPKNIARYVDWYEKLKEPPRWCPRRKS